LHSKQHTPTTDRIYWVVLVLNITGMLSALFLFNYRINLVASMVLTIATLGLVLGNGIHIMILGVRQARFFLAAWLFFLLGGALNVLKSAGILPDTFITTYGIQIGSALEAMVLSLGMGDRINQLSASLQKNVKALSVAQNESEKVGIRLQTLVEEADDFIFTLDESWNFTMVNKTFQRILKYGQEELLSMNFLELIYNRDWKDSLNKIFALEKLEELSKPGTSVSFQTEFKQKHVMEPRDTQIQLQYLQYEDGRREILGRGNIITEDVLARYLIKERVEFSIENYVRNAEILSQRLSSLISRFADAEVQMTVRTSLREIIINAIEHGNLEITFDEKTKALEEGSYLALIEERRENPKFKNRKIYLEYSIDEDRVAFRVTDEGQGFDHRKMLKTDEKKLNEDFMAHGRGIMMTVSAFDIVRYNEKGNRVALVKYFKKNRS
ncbi:MAG TPA: histidine kinase, partial [Leptospiraceae bacterium]|nr:histidine kinase [Leptospiraceae bacterium]